MTIPATHSAAYVIPGLRIVRTMSAAEREEKIKKVVRSYFHVTENELVKKQRYRRIVLARQFCQYLLFNYKNPPHNSCERICMVHLAGMFRQDHSTITYTIQMIENQLSSRIDNQYKQDYACLLALLNEM